MNLPSYEFLPAPLWLVTLLHVVTLTLHFVAMGAVFGGLGAVLLLPRAARERPAVAGLLKLLPTLMALTVTLGVAPLLFLQLVYHRQVYAAAIVSGWFWLGLVAAVIGAYYLLYATALSTAARPRTGALLAALALLLYVSMVLTTVFTLAETPATLAAAWANDASGAVLNPDLARWLPRWLHVVAGALVIGSFALAVAVREDEELARAARGIVLWSFVGAALLGVAALVGLGDDLVPYMRSAAVWWMLGSLLAGLVALHLLFRRKLVAAGALLFVSLVGMVVQRHVARIVVLRDTFDPASIPVRPQWGVFALFLVCFVGMLGVVAWMLRLYFAPRPPADA